MPFLIRPPLDSVDADYSIQTYFVIEPDHNDRTVMRDLLSWGWRITRHDFSDKDFIQTMIAIDKDVKTRRRQTHAIAGELHGYCERLTLEQVWDREAERVLVEDPHASPPTTEQPRSFSRMGNIEDCEIKVEKWLRAVDRTRQTNGFLEYTDPEHEFPRLIEHGLDHHCLECERELPWVQYQKDHPRCDETHHATEPKIKHQRHDRHKQLPELPQRRRTICLIFSCCNRTNSCRRSKDTSDLPTPPPPPLLPHLQRRHNFPNLTSILHSPNPSYLAQPKLIFPNEHISKRCYFRQSRPCLPRSNRSNSSAAAPGVYPDPYGWLKWDKDMQRINGVKAQWKFFVARERRRSLDSRARKRLGEEMVERSRVEEEEEGLKRHFSNEVRKEKTRKREKTRDEQEDAVLMFTGAWNSFGWG